MGILVGSAPARGINGVIAATTIAAKNGGLYAIGIMDGFHWLYNGDTDHVKEMEIDDVSRIKFSGGLIIRKSRANR